MAVLKGLYLKFGPNHETTLPINSMIFGIIAILRLKNLELKKSRNSVSSYFVITKYKNSASFGRH